MKKLISITGLLMAISLLVLLLPACSKPAPAPTPGTIPAPAPVQGPFSVGSSRSSADMPVPAPTPAPVIKIPSQESPNFGGVVVSSDAGQMIVRTGDMSLVVEDVQNTIDRITELTNNYQGNVVSSQSWEQGERMVGNIAIRVPSERFDDAIRALRALAVDITSESTSSKDVTEEYTDLGAKLRNLEATEVQLLRLMEKAEKVEDILLIQKELSNTRQEIERTKARMLYLERTSAMSLINVHLEQSKLTIEFSATRRVKEGEDAHFSSQIAGGFSPYSYVWDFGDGNTSTDTSPTHAYKKAGDYTISLTVTDDKGNDDTQTRDNYITVTAGWRAGEVLTSAVRGFVVFVQWLVNIALWLIIFVPVWGTILGIILWRRRRRAKASH